MKLLKSITFSLFCIIINFHNIYARKAPIKYGKVDISELEMEYYEHDSSAPAVVLCEYGYFNSAQFNFTHIIRIKILKKEGTHWANIAVATPNKTEVKGRTYNLVNGEINVDKLNSKNVYRDNIIDDYSYIRIPMPNVKAGSVIEILYTHSGIPINWYFQREIPVKHSELIIERSPYIVFSVNYFGFESLDVRTGTRWLATNMPAFKEEPFMNSVENYLTKIELDISSEKYVTTYIDQQGYTVDVKNKLKDYANTWETISNFLIEHYYFGDALAGCLFLNKTVDSINTKFNNDQDKVNAAYDFINNKVEWDERKRLMVKNSNLLNTFNEETGNSAEINLMLVSLLNKLDIEANPVILSTRDNGLLSPINPSLFKLNYVIVKADIEGESILLDATENYLPAGLLPERCMNWKGRVIDIDTKKSDWVDLKTNKKEKEIIYYDLELNRNGKLLGRITNTNIDYSAYIFRREYHEYNSHEEYLEDFTKYRPGLKIIDSRIIDLDSIYKPVIEEYKVEISNQIIELDSTIYLNPLLYCQLIENPFKIDERKYPVDYTYPIDKTIILKLTLPDNYTVADFPKSINMKLPGNGASFLYQITTLGDIVQLTYKFNINKELFLEDEYADLREFYNQVINKHSEPIILKIN